MKWKELDSNCRTFWSEGEEEVIHVIKTGFTNEYMVVHEDAHEQKYGQVDICTSEYINEHFNIKL